MKKSIIDEPSRIELQLDTTTTIIPSTPVATDTLGENLTNAPKTIGKLNMAFTVKPIQCGQQKVDTDLNKPLDPEPTSLSGTFINNKFNVLREKYNIDKFEY